MSTPPNPPATPTGPPTEPTGTPVPETASIPAPAQPLSPSLEKTPTAATPETPQAPEAPSDPETPEAPEAAPAPVTPETPAAPATPAQEPAAAPAPGPSQFAPPAPAPAPQAQPIGAPDAPGAPAAPAAPGNVWAQPGPDFGGLPYSAHPQAAPATNGLAIAALIVACFAVIIGIVPFMFWAGALLAVIAVGLGIGALVSCSKGAPRKTMSLVGTVLGVVGLGVSVVGFFLTADVADRLGREIDRQQQEEREELDGPFPSGEPWPSKSPSPSQVPGLTSALPFGETFTYPNGVKVSLSAPKKYEPKGIIARERVENAIQITITITNGSTAPHEVIYAMPNVRDDQGMTADMVFDSGGSGGGVPKMIRGSILPGESASGVVAFEVPEGTRSITADISAGTMLDDVKYAGPIG